MKVKFRKLIAFVIQNLLLLLLAGGCIFVFKELSEKLLDGRKGITMLDNSAWNFFKSLQSSWLNNVMRWFSFLGSFIFLPIAAIVLLIVLFLKKYKFYAIILLILLAGSSLLNVVLKYLFNRSRPDVHGLTDAAWLSYPSGHAMSGICFYGFLIYLTCKLIANNAARLVTSLFLMLIITMIGVSRIYLGVHYASDVVAGFAAGGFWLAVFLIYAETKFRKQIFHP